MLIGVASFKGSPGVTSTALALAAVWPRPVVLLEADPAGGDLTYRARAAHGGPVYGDRGLLRMATGVRGVSAGADAVTEQAQLLACGVNLVQGVASASQARGLSGGLWSAIADACVGAEVDVIADLGRLDRSSGVMPLVQACATLIPVASCTLESVMHATNGAQDLVGELSAPGAVRLIPVLVGPDASAGRDCSDLDNMLHRAGLRTEPTMPMAVDPKALLRLERGERAEGRLGRTLLIRAAHAIATVCTNREAAA